MRTSSFFLQGILATARAQGRSKDFGMHASEANRRLLKDFGMRARRRAPAFRPVFAEDSRDGTRATAFERFRHARAKPVW